MNYLDRLVIVVLCVASCSLGYGLYQKLHADDYRMGWNAGYDAREQQAQDDNARFAGAGLCTLASFSCETFLHPKGKHK